MLDPDASESVTTIGLPADGEIVLAVGPEGGIAPAETEALLAAGAVAARLGPTVLRASIGGRRRGGHPAQPHPPLGLTTRPEPCSLDQRTSADVSRSPRAWREPSAAGLSELG